MNFDHIRCILVETTHPGNIGAAARSMKTMGLERLVLVKPTCFPHAEATARAAGAVDLLERTPVVDSLDAALAGCHVVIGTSARRRGVTAPTLDPRECAAQVAELSDQVQIALVFGRESSGLTNDEADRCNFLVHIPTNPRFSSLNLAAAVQILAYELQMHVWTKPEPQPQNELVLPAPAQEIARFYGHLEQVLLETGFLNPANPRHLMRWLRRLFNRAQLDQREVNILRGILSSVQGYRRSVQGYQSHCAKTE